MDNKNVSGWVRIIECIDKPLGFFVLALLIVESFLGTVLIFSNFTEDHRFYGMLIGVIMFIFVIVMVVILVWNKPHNLTYDKEAHLVDTGKIPYGDDSKILKNGDIKKLLPIQSAPSEEGKTND